MLWNWVQRFRAYRHVELATSGASFFAAQNVRFFMKPRSNINISNGCFHFGFPLPGGVAPYASYQKNILSLGEGSSIICKGDVFIAPGATIRLGPGAKLILGGGNLIAHNLTLICNKNVEIKRGASISWGVTLIDDDGHHFCKTDGKPLRRFLRPLIIGENAGIQMNVLIPSGVKIGDHSVIGAGTILRQDIPSDSICYTTNQLRIKQGLRTNFGFNKIENEEKDEQ